MEMISVGGSYPGDYTIYPDSRNARELRARIDNWPLATRWFGTASATGATSSFIDRFLQFDIMFIEAVCSVVSRFR